MSLPRAANPANRPLVRRTRPSLRAVVVCAGACAVFGGSCLPTEGLIPLDGPRYPTGLAVTPDGNELVVVSSNFDLAFDDGAVLVADLTKVRAKTADADGDVVVQDAYLSGAYLPPFGDAPAMTSDGARLFVPARGSNLIASLDLSQTGNLGCGKDAGDPPRCGVAPRALQLPANDPLSTLILTETTTDTGAIGRVVGMTALLSSPDVYLFSDDPSRPAAERMQIVGTINLGEGVGGVRSVVVRPELYGSDRVAIAAAEIDPDTGVFGTLLAIFPPTAGADVTLFDVSRETGSLAMRDLVLVPGEDGASDALLVALRAPEAIARYELDDGGDVPVPRLAGLEPTCRTPTSLALAEPVPGVHRVLVTCQDGDVVQMIDPVTLAATDAVRFEGRSPYDVVVNGAVDPPEAYVSFFLDNSIGVLTLASDGEPAMRFRGRIGAALPRPEDGRE
jgi:hypothetical protein